MYKLIALIILITILAIGFIKILKVTNKHQRNLDFTYDFINKFREFGNELVKEHFNQELYEWLKMNSYKMQSLSGNFGIAHAYVPPGSNYLFKNYQIITNGITEIKNIYQGINKEYGGLDIDWKMLQNSIGMIDDVLLSYIGFLKDRLKQKYKNLKNPLVWFREGIQFIVTLPISLIYWSGIINYRSYNKINDNLIVKLISFTVGLIAFIGSIITIITGYTPFLNSIKNLLENLK